MAKSGTGPIYGAIGVTLAGDKDIFGVVGRHRWGGPKFWMAVLTDLSNRGVKDTFFVVCDDLNGLPEVVGNVWLMATVQTCIIHYADVRIMPISGLDPLTGKGSWLERSA